MIKKSFTEISNWIIYWYGTKRNVIVGGEIERTPYHQTKLFIWALKATLWLLENLSVTKLFMLRLLIRERKALFFFYRPKDLFTAQNANKKKEGISLTSIELFLSKILI